MSLGAVLRFLLGPNAPLLPQALSKHQAKKPNVCSDHRIKMNPYHVTDLKRRKRYPERFVLSSILLKQTVPASRFSYDFSRKMERETARALRVRERLLHGKTSPRPIHTNRDPSPDFSQNNLNTQPMSLNFFRTYKNFSQQIYLTEDDQSIQTASKVDICIESKTSPPQTLCHHFPQSQAQGFSNVFFVVVLQIRVERKMRRFEKMQF